MKKDSVLRFILAFLGGLALSGITFLIEIDNYFGWPIYYYIDDPARCDDFKCWTALTEFYPKEFVYNSLFWILIVFLFLSMTRKIKKGNKK
ncbi:MAG: hypothetical protein PHT36_01935 [Patescibacteria group bacterium]|nr:hypothetical protein [Patescibacteria group bacterium]